MESDLNQAGISNRPRVPHLCAFCAQRWVPLLLSTWESEEITQTNSPRVGFHGRIERGI